jgi:predicted transcriptional regulator
VKKGRPRAEFDIKMVESLAAIGCTIEEISVLVGVSTATLKRRATEQISRGHEEMKTSLRRWQYLKAKEGSVPMLIWLGKQYLGQRDKIDETRREEVVTIERIAPKIALADTA